MKALSNRPASFYLFIGALMLVGYLVIKKRGQDRGDSPVATKASRQLQTFEELPSSPMRARKNLLSQRQKTLSLLTSGGSRFVPQIEEQGLVVTFELQPQGRPCRLGDLDMMEKVLGSKGRIMVSVRDDAGRSALERSVSLEELKRPLTIPVRLERIKQLKAYRFSLCSDDGTESCHRALAADFKTVEHSLMDSKVKGESRHNLLWQSLTFTSLDQDLHVLDATQNRPYRSIEQLVKNFQGQTRQTSFLHRALQDQHRLGSVPAQIKGQTLILPLYFNDKSACTVAGGKGS